MLTEKELLLINEFVKSYRLKISNIDENIETIISKITTQSSLLSEISSYENLIKAKLHDIYTAKNIIIYTFFIKNSVYVVVNEKENDESSLEFADKAIENIIKFIENKKCTITGIKSLLTPYIADRLNLNSVVFGTILIKNPYKNLINYVGENEPVGEIRENIVFVKQYLANDNLENELYYSTYIFENDGSIIPGNQTEYSKFATWFYNSVNTIDKEIWKLFFNSQNKEDDFIDNNIYSLFVDSYRLDNESVLESLKNVIKLIELKLDRNRENIKIDFYQKIMKVENVDFNKEITIIADTTAENAANIVKTIFKNVETIIMGYGVFNIGREKFDSNKIMEYFSVSIEKILDLEIQNISSDLDKVSDEYIDILTGTVGFDN